MKNKSLLGLLLLIGAVIACTAYAASPPQANQTVQQNRSNKWEYAELNLEAENQVTWAPSGSNVIPQVRTFRDLYGRMGGGQRATFVNLLGQIGADGWELVTTDQATWTFKRAR